MKTKTPNPPTEIQTSECPAHRLVTVFDCAILPAFLYFCKCIQFIFQAYIRSKAVTVMHHFYRVSPQLCLEYVNRMKMMVGDKDPGVVAHVLQFLLAVVEVC